MSFNPNEKDELNSEKDQLLLSYTENREPIDVQPRSDFLDSTKVKVVVWAFIFTSDGKVLIHRRKDNAKDNRGMWDKSVGGHVERSDIESAKAIAREVAEELYTDECLGNKENNINLANELVRQMKFLGEWEKSSNAQLVPQNDCFIYYRVNYDFSKQIIHSYRLLPSKKKVSVTFFADVFFFIAPNDFTIKNLYNSDYLLIDLQQLKKATLDEKLAETNAEFIVTPDLKYIIDSQLWEDLNVFSNKIYNKRKT